MSGKPSTQIQQQNDPHKSTYSVEKLDNRIRRRFWRSQTLARVRVSAAAEAIH